MRPILYGAGETDFSNNGLGILSDCVSCEVEQERNGIFELTMKYPENGLRFSDLQLRRIILASPDNVSRPQPFRIYEISKPIGGVVTVYAQHLCYDLMGIPVSPFKASSAAGAMLALSKNAAVDCPFTFQTDKNTSADMDVKVPTTIWELLGGSRGGILDVYGGEYEFDRWNVRLWKSRGYDRGVTIRYGKNLLTLKQDENCEAVYTGVYPFWADSDGNLVTLPEKIVNASGTYSFTRIMTKDFSEEWEEAPTAAQLRSRTETYIKANKIGVPKVSLDVSFVPLEQTEEYKDIKLLEQVGLCDTVTVIFPALGVSATAECIKTTFDCLTERYKKITLGDSRISFADAIIDQQKEITKRPTDSAMKSAIGNATQLISGSKGGRVITVLDEDSKPMELCILSDSEDLSTAKSLWRWNEGGLGHSKTGYNGPFELAMTKDGAIVADRITVGTLNAGIVKAGILSDDKGKNHWDLESGEFATSGTISSYDGPKGKLAGYLGYMTGSTEAGTTSGIGVSNAGDDCYAIATDSGIRLQAGDYSIYVTKSGVVKLTGSAGTVEITKSGDKGAGVYITGKIYKRSSSSGTWTAL